MDGFPNRSGATLRALVGAMGGSIGGALIGGLTGQLVGIVIACADKDMAGFGSWMVFAFCAVLAAPGAAIAGAFGSVWRRALPGAIAGLTAGFVVSLYPIILFWLYDDESWTYSCLVSAAALIFSAVLAGAVAGCFSAGE